MDPIAFYIGDLKTVDRKTFYLSLTKTLKITRTQVFLEDSENTTWISIGFIGKSIGRCTDYSFEAGCKLYSGINIVKISDHENFRNYI